MEKKNQDEIKEHASIYTKRIKNCIIPYTTAAFFSLYFVAYMKTMNTQRNITHAEIYYKLT